ncbi:helix-turn-helix domain-containing protein [Aurantivibrio plasticivorans]
MSETTPTCPVIYIWKNRRLYLGTQFVPLREYETPADQLVIALEGKIIFNPPGEAPIETRSILMRAGTPVLMEHVDTTNAIIAICWLDPIGQDYFVNELLMQDKAPEVANAYYNHKYEQDIIDAFLRLRSRKPSAEDAESILEKVLIPTEYEGQEVFNFDPRIIKVMQRIRETVKENLPVKALAEEVFLSESRLLKLFKSQIGIPIRRYRLRHRLFVGIMHLSGGASVTEAAIESGFASSAHFSKSYSALFGIQPTGALMKPPFAEVFIPENFSLDSDDKE